VGALLKMSKQMEIKKMMVITKDEEDTISELGRTIEVVPVWKWVLRET
jgi:predicted AAA+ superfamily ATPase